MSSSVGILYVGEDKVTPFISLNQIPTVTKISTSTGAITLSSYKIYMANQLSSLSVTFPSTLSTGFISEVNFTSSSTPTSFTSSTSVVWSGDSISNNNFVPQANYKYTIVFYCEDGNYKGAVSGIAL